MEILKKITSEANYLQFKGDIEFGRQNYQEAVYIYCL